MPRMYTVNEFWTKLINRSYPLASQINSVRYTFNVRVFLQEARLTMRLEKLKKNRNGKHRFISSLHKKALFSNKLSFFGELLLLARNGPAWVVISTDSVFFVGPALDCHN